MELLQLVQSAITCDSLKNDVMAWVKDRVGKIVHAVGAKSQKEASKSFICPVMTLIATITKILSTHLLKAFSLSKEDIILFIVLCNKAESPILHPSFFFSYVCSHFYSPYINASKLMNVSSVYNSLYVSLPNNIELLNGCLFYMDRTLLR